jgi:tRNA uridine 5-carboxymethylaminomethyl modification enzyme
MSSLNKTGVALYSLIKRNISYTELLSLYGLPEYDEDVREEVQTMARYDGYIAKQREQVEAFRRMENTALPDELDYLAMEGLRIEARQKLSAQRPENIGRASRISGVSPADISVLLVYLKKLEGSR